MTERSNFIFSSLEAPWHRFVVLMGSWYRIALVLVIDISSPYIVLVLVILIVNYSVFVEKAKQWFCIFLYMLNTSEISLVVT